MLSKSQKIQALKDYFDQQPEVILAFLFGSRSKAKKYQHWGSDWDIGVYFKPGEYMETETRENYPAEKGMWGALVNICESNDVDLVVLNRARPDLVYSVLKQAFPLKLRDKNLYFDLLCKTNYEAKDWWQFVNDYWQISEKAASLAREAKKNIIECLRFLENEFNEISRIKKFTWEDYLKDSFTRKIIERWVENLVMSAIDIAEIVLASEKKNIPSSYKDTLKLFYGLYIDKKVDEAVAEKFSEFAKLRNIVVHEYLDIRWQRIKNFIQDGEKLYPSFIEKVKEIINQN